MLINKQKIALLKHLNDCKTFIEYPNDIHENIEEYSPFKQLKILIIFGDMIANILNDEKHNPIVTKLFITGTKLNIALVFITQSYYVGPKIISLNFNHYFIIKIRNKWIIRYCIR